MAADAWGCPVMPPIDRYPQVSIQSAIAFSLHCSMYAIAFLQQYLRAVSII